MTSTTLYKLCKKHGEKNKKHKITCNSVYANVVCLCALVLMTGCHCDEVSMTLWPILLQHNPFLTMLVDPNGLTQDGWCERDVVPRHKYRPHRHTLPTETGLFLLGIFREHSVTGLHFVKRHIYRVLHFLLPLIFLALPCHPAFGWISHFSACYKY